MDSHAAASPSLLHVGADEEFVREAVATLWTGSERPTVTSVDGADGARERLESGRVDCLVCEHDRPDGSGTALVSDIRTERPDLPCLFVTRDGSDVDDALAAGATDVLVRRDAEDARLLARRLDTLLARSARNRVGAVFDAVPYPFAHVRFEDGEPLVERVNDAFERVFGFEGGDIAGTSLDEHIVPDGEREGAREINERTRAGDALEREVVRRTADGDRREFLFRSASLTHPDGTVEGVAAYVDITERVERERKLRWYEGVLETTRDTAAVIDEDGRFAMVNGRLAEIYDATPEDLRGERSHLVSALRERDEGDPFGDLVEGRREEFRTELELEYPHGTRISDVRMTRLVEDDQFAGVVAVGRDVTERVERERELELKNRAMDEAPVGITISDPAREVNPLVYVNDRFEEVTGYAKDEVRGRNCRFLQGENTEPEPVDTLRQGIDDADPVTVELRNYRKDGTEFWNEVTVAPIEDEGEVTNYVGFQRDVTERVERKLELKLRNRAMEEAPIGITIHDATDGRRPITFANSGFRELTGYGDGTLDGATLSLLTGEETDPDRYATLEGAFDGGEPAETVLLLYREDGTPFWGRVSIAPVTDGDDEVTHFVGFLQDVTDTKRHAEEIERRLDEFGDVLAEELRTPLHEAKRSLQSATADGASEDVEAAEQSLRRVDKLIDDLTTVHSFSVKSRDVFEAVGGSDDDG